MISPWWSTFQPLCQSNVGNVRQETIMCFLLQIFVFSMFKMFWLMRGFGRGLVLALNTWLENVPMVCQQYLVLSPQIWLEIFQCWWNIWFCWHIYLIIYPVLFWLKIPGSVVTISAGKCANDLLNNIWFYRLDFGQKCPNIYMVKNIQRTTYGFQCICGLQKFYSGSLAESVRLDTDEMTLLDEYFFAERGGKWGEAVGEGRGMEGITKKARFTWQPPARRELWVLPGLKMLQRCQWCAQPGGRKDAADLARGTWLDGCVS